MKMCFRPHNFYSKARALIEECDAICHSYAVKGYALTLRQLFYQLVIRNLIANLEREYRNVGQVISDARYAGLIDWNHITDRVRFIRNSYDGHFTDPEDLLTYHAEDFNIDLWRDQLYRPEIWVEKDALAEIVERVCYPIGVPYVPVKAYNSTSEMWAARQRFLQHLRDDRIPVILHIGDHDSTGEDCSRHLRETIELLVGQPVELVRIALNRDQIEKYELPPQPGKSKDPRFKGYVAKHGTTHTWEVDALGPDILERIIDNGVRQYMDPDVHEAALERRLEYRKQLEKASHNWQEIQEFLETRP